MNRSKQIIIATILTVLFALQNIIRIVIALAAQDQIAQEMGNGFLAVALIVFTIMLVSAYGVWHNQKWGKILVIITLILNGLPALLSLVFENNFLGILDVTVAIIIIFLLLRRTEKTVTA